MSRRIRWLVDENLSNALFDGLRHAGDDVERQAILAHGMPDRAVLAAAFADSRILVTGDKGFGELVYLRVLSAAGIVLLREGRLTMAEVERELLRRRDEIALTQPGSFVTFIDTRVRVRPLP